MTDVAEPMTAKATAYVGYHRSAQATDRLRRRYARERRFKLYGLAAVLIALAMLAFILIDIVGKRSTAFVPTKVELEVYFDPAALAAGDDRSALMGAGSQWLAEAALYGLFPAPDRRRERRALRAPLIPAPGSELRRLGRSGARGGT